MADIPTGKKDTSMDKPGHTKGTSRVSLGDYESQPGHNPDGTSTAQRSTGVNPKAQEPIDPRMPNLSPA